MIPATDNVPPRLELTITGPGVGRRTMTNPPRDEWTGEGGVQLFDLQRNSRYDFMFVVSDSGGVARAHVRMPAEFTILRLSPEAVQSEADALQRRLTLLGNRSDPRTGLVITGSFQTPTAGGLTFEFQTEGDDFGGTAGSSNQRFMNVSAATN